MPDAGWADRHCFPVLDAYYAARQTASSDALDQDARLARLLSKLGAARELSQICSCTQLSEAIDRLITNVESVEDPSSLGLIVLSANESINTAIYECHY